MAANTSLRQLLLDEMGGYLGAAIASAASVRTGLYKGPGELNAIKIATGVASEANGRQVP